MIFLCFEDKLNLDEDDSSLCPITPTKWLRSEPRGSFSQSVTLYFLDGNNELLIYLKNAFTLHLAPVHSVFLECKQHTLHVTLNSRNTVK